MYVARTKWYIVRTWSAPHKLVNHRVCPCIQKSTPNVLDWVDSVGLARLGVDLTSGRWPVLTKGIFGEILLMDNVVAFRSWVEPVFGSRVHSSDFEVSFPQCTYGSKAPGSAHWIDILLYIDLWYAKWGINLCDYRIVVGMHRPVDL